MIEVICNVFAENAHNTDIERMLNKRVSNIIKDREGGSGEKESITVELRAFGKDFYFNPGLYESADNSES